jgi:hypothetical protein
MDQLQEQLMQRQMASPSIDQQVSQRQGINGMMAKMGGQPPTTPPVTPSAAPPMPTKMGSFSFGSQIPDIESLVKAMQKSGMTHSRTEDIELKPSVQDLLNRARAIPGQ